MDPYLVEYPIHIKYLISDLESCVSPISILSKYIPTLPTDSTLTEIFKNLGYSEESDCFTREPSHYEALQALRGYSKTQDGFSDHSSESWDVSRGIKEEFLKTYYDAKLNELSEVFELGLNPFELDESSLDSIWSTPPDKKLTASISTEESTPRQCRGLKYLTGKVKNIIFTKGFISYKEVSDELVRELEIIDGLDREKEEKNILRRVYDALNVLIASGVVVKQNKKYVWHYSGNEGIELLKKSLREKSERIEEKRRALKEIWRKFAAVKDLFNRNIVKKEPDAIKFPFIVVATEEHPENMIRMECSSDRTDVCIKFMKNIRLYGDLEVVLQLDIGKDLEAIPKEIRDLIKL
jgi:hypothetical protein